MTVFIKFAEYKRLRSCQQDIVNQSTRPIYELYNLSPAICCELLASYGINIALQDSTWPDRYEIVDPKKYMLFQIKYPL